MTKKKNNIKSNNKVKNAPKKVDNNVEVQSVSDELKKLVTILVSIVVVVCVFYVITIIVTKNNQQLKYRVSDETSQISYTDILASDILAKNGTYYVLVKNDGDSYMSLYETYISSYISSEDHLMVYSVDLNDALNKTYKADQNNFAVDNLKFKDTVLLKVSNGNVESTYETAEEINEHLKSLASK